MGDLLKKNGRGMNEQEISIAGAQLVHAVCLVCVCMYVCMHVCMYVCICECQRCLFVKCVHLCLSISCVSIYLCMCVMVGERDGLKSRGNVACP